MTQEALKALIHEMEYVLSCINEEKIPFDGDDFHEALRLGKEALAQTEQERPADCERCNRLEEQAYDLVGKLRVANIKLSMQPQRTWVGLTESDVSDVCANNHPLDGVFTFARAIEAKLKEKNSA